MTNYNERLDEILDNYIATFKDTLNGRDEDTHSKAKQAIKQLVADEIEAICKASSDSNDYIVSGVDSEKFFKALNEWLWEEK